MKTDNPKLLHALADALPAKFLNSLNLSVPGIYSEAHSMAFDSPTMGQPEAEYLRPHARRALLETALRRAAHDCGLTASVKPNCRGTSSYTLIHAGPFLITASHVGEPDKFVRSALFRNDHAELNSYLAQGELFGSEQGKNEQREKAEKKIYCIMLHGADAENPQKLGFMQFAFPDEHNKRWIDAFNFVDVLSAAEARNGDFNSEERDQAFPSIKRQIQTGAG